MPLYSQDCRCVPFVCLEEKLLTKDYLPSIEPSNGILRGRSTKNTPPKIDGRALCLPPLSRVLLELSPVGLGKAMITCREREREKGTTLD